MSTRTDAHSPANLDPAAYTYLEPIYLGPRVIKLEDPWWQHQLALKRRIAQEGVGGNFNQRGTCDHCGASFLYGAIFRHDPSGKLVVVGHQCADGAFGYDNRRTYEYARSRKQAAALRRRLKAKADAEQFLVDHPGLEEALTCSHRITQDLRSKLFQYGSLSDKQVALAMKLPADQAEYEARKAREAAEREAAPDWPQMSGRVEVEGTVVSCRWDDTGWGSALKMLVKLDDGRKCWGTCPRSVENDLMERSGSNSILDELKGRRVRFQAAVQVSDDDSKFAFFKRPAKAEVL